MSESHILIGGSGHAKVIIDCIQASGGSVAGILDDGLTVGSSVLGVPVLGMTDDYEVYKDHKFIVAIGSNSVRRRIAERINVQWGTVIHPSAVVSTHATIGPGTVVMANAVINAGAVIGKHCIINTSAIIEHDNQLGDYVHISPNAALGGTVTISESTHVGIGVCVSNNISICSGCTIGAGAAVVKDITEPGIYAGVPARKMK